MRFLRLKFCLEFNVGALEEIFYECKIWLFVCGILTKISAFVYLFSDLISPSSISWREIMARHV